MDVPDFMDWHNGTCTLNRNSTGVILAVVFIFPGSGAAVQRRHTSTGGLFSFCRQVPEDKR